MNILHVVPTLAPAAGGTTTVVRQMARAQAQVGHKVTICTTNRDYPRGRLPVVANAPGDEDGVEIIYFRALFGPLLISFGLVSWLRKHMTDFDVVHIHALYRVPVTYAAYRARRQGVPYVMYAHGSLSPHLRKRSRYGRLLKLAYERIFEVRNLNGASLVQFATAGEKEQAGHLRLRAPSAVIPNGVDWEYFAAPVPRGRFRSRIDADMDSPLVLFVGRLDRNKGLDLLIPAFVRVVRDMPDARLVIAGADTDGLGAELRRRCARKAIADRVIFVGQLSRECLREAYVDADVFVLPSYMENFGMTVVEAMAAGVPVVISDQVNLHKVVEDAEAGIVTRCDVDEVGNALRLLLGDIERRRNAGVAAKRLVRERFAWSRVVDLLTQEYTAVIGTNGVDSLVGTIYAGGSENSPI